MRLSTKRKTLFVLDIHTLPDKAMSSKKRDRSTYLLSKNPHIRLWYQKLLNIYISNAGVVKASKLNDGVDITIDKGQEERFYSDPKLYNVN